MIKDESTTLTDNYNIHDLMEVIIVILDARDPYTYEHSWRVSALSEKIVSQFDISEEWAKAIHIAAHLHDIGKIGVPDYILNKPGKLTEFEFEKIKEHPEIGFRIVDSMETLDKIGRYVRHHHERWDGTGYPCGLEGKDIPFGARIIAVADTFDAITSSRSYHKKRDFESAFRTIENVSGSQLCPEVCEAFIGIRDEIPTLLDDVNKEIAKRMTRSPLGNLENLKINEIQLKE